MNHSANKQSTGDLPAGQEQSLTRVLVIEDNQDLAHLFRDLLEVLNCVADIAFSVRGAIELAQDHPPDLVFCDLRLPGGKSGFDFAREFRSEERFARVPLIAVSGKVEPEDYELAHQAGFDRVLTKPFRFADIQQLLSTVVVSDRA